MNFRNDLNNRETDHRAILVAGWAVRPTPTDAEDARRPRDCGTADRTGAAAAVCRCCSGSDSGRGHFISELTQTAFTQGAIL